MSVPVAVIDPAPAYRRGLTLPLTDAGFAPTEFKNLENLGDWDADKGRRAVLVTVRLPADCEQLKAVKAKDPGDLIVVAVLSEPTPDAYAEALRLSAHAAVAWDDLPEYIIEVLHAAVQGKALLPLEIAHALAVRGPATYERKPVTPAEIEWLRALAGGTTIHTLAARVGYSERAFYRLLRGLYARMGASNRTEAILQANRWGLLD